MQRIILTLESRTMFIEEIRLLNWLQNGQSAETLLLYIKFHSHSVKQLYYTKKRGRTCSSSLYFRHTSRSWHVRNPRLSPKFGFTTVSFINLPKKCLRLCHGKTDLIYFNNLLIYGVRLVKALQVSISYVKKFSFQISQFKIVWPNR